MKKNIETPEDVRDWFFTEAAKIWPFAGGSLSLRKNSCIRPNCIACISGEGHPAYALHNRLKGKQTSIYVPDDLADDIAKAVKNGQLLRELLVEAGRRYVKARKSQRRKK
ncbi:MAG: hypothetical protein HZA06_06820 [Nitrospirae bacterium]|nr:hypothetical protein [Nitrospirota bacterium]